jgi:hypothetical protein
MSAVTTRRLRLLACALLFACGAAAATEPPAEPPGRDHAYIGGAAGSDASGRIAINQAAGSGNAQANLAGIALSATGTGLVELQAHQQTTSIADRSREARARIEGGAFAGTRGVLSLNQTAGSGNGQVNLFAVGQSGAGVLVDAVITSLDDAALATVAGQPVSESTDTTVPVRQARIADGAFRGSQGVVQVNQTAGVGNFSTNAIVLQLPGGTP